MLLPLDCRVIWARAGRLAAGSCRLVHGADRPPRYRIEQWEYPCVAGKRTRPVFFRPQTRLGLQRNEWLSAGVCTPRLESILRGLTLGESNARMAQICYV